MTQREYERMRTSGYRRGYSYHQTSSDQEVPADGYFAFFKLRCLICLVLFLGLVAVDRRLDARDNVKVQQVMSYINEEKIPVGKMLKGE